MVIRKPNGAIATIVVYLRKKFKLTSEVKSKAITMAKKGSQEKERGKPSEPKGPNKPND